LIHEVLGVGLLLMVYEQVYIMKVLIVHFKLLSLQYDEVQNGS